MGSLLAVIAVFIALLVVVGYFWYRQQRQEGFGAAAHRGTAKASSPEEALASIIEARRAGAGGPPGERGPGPGAALGALIDQVRVMNQLMGKGGSTPTFGPSDLGEVKAAFARFRREPGEPAAQACFQLMRRHYILDTEMARQEAYFLEYATEVLRQVREHPSVLETPMSMYIKYLAVDLGDSGSPALGRLGQDLTAAIQAAGHTL